MSTQRAPLSLVNTSLSFIGIALLCLLFADIEVSTLDPWGEMGRFAYGVITPNFFGIENLVEAIMYTVTFAMVGVTIGSLCGFGLSIVFHMRAVRLLCAFARSVHELFWALLFLQIFGLTAITGILALVVPYAGIFAKVYAEIYEEADKGPLKVVPANSDVVSTLFYAQLPVAWEQIKTYTLYRMECGIRSSAVLGFVGLPTLGFHLESAFSQGEYSVVWALLFIFYFIIITMRYWMRSRLLPFYFFASLFMLPSNSGISWANIARFFGEDIVPHPIRTAQGIDGEFISSMGHWLNTLLIEQALPGAINTIALTMIALVCTGALTMALFPFISSRFFGKPMRAFGATALVVMRSTPEYILAFIFLQLWGPSMAPAIVALSIHNGAIIAHLMGHHTESLKLRLDAPKGLNLYAYEIVPRIYKPFLAFLFYRWEVIMRETAILGILGIKTLGFYVDSSFADIRIDRAALLILVTAFLNIGIDSISRRIRKRINADTILT